MEFYNNCPLNSWLCLCSERSFPHISFLKVIERLKREIQQLKDELAMANGTEYDEELTEEIRKRFLYITLTIAVLSIMYGIFLKVGLDIYFVKLNSR